MCLQRINTIEPSKNEQNCGIVVTLRIVLFFKRTVHKEREKKMSQLKKEKIGIFGSGLIGGSWAMIFASVGYQVKIRFIFLYYQSNSNRSTEI